MTSSDNLPRRIRKLQASGAILCEACNIDRDAMPAVVILDHGELPPGWQPGVSYCAVCGNITEERVQLEWPS